MKASADRLFELLPVVYRQRDAEQGWPLRALLRVIAEQVDVVEDDIEQLYANWFIETCEDWVVPYIGDLIGYRLPEAVEDGDGRTSEAELALTSILIPRREVANTIRYRRRKGTLALLELLAADVAAWPARAVEFFKLLGLTQPLNHLRLERGRTVDVREMDALERLDGPFDQSAHTVEVRRIVSPIAQGRYNIPSVGLFVWRLESYSVTLTQAYCSESNGPHCYTFSALGNDVQLYNRPQPEHEPTSIAGELNLPTPIRRRSLETRIDDYYGGDRSVYIWVGDELQPIRAEQVVVADLSGWQYRARPGEVALDPQLGRISFHPGEEPEQDVWVYYHYAFSADVGGGEYNRPLSRPATDHVVYRVGRDEELTQINQALERWRHDQAEEEAPSDRLRSAVIEVTDSRVYAERLNIELATDERLYLRAANRKRPIIFILDWQPGRPDSLRVTGEPGSCLTLDGLMIAGRGVRLNGELADVSIRHSTLLPGWEIGPDCEPVSESEPSLEIYGKTGCVTIDKSILGSIRVHQDEVTTDPIPIFLRDSILDATSPELEALGAPGWPAAHVVLTVQRSTVFGYIETHAIELAENSIFIGVIRVRRRQRGCMRFCYVTPESRTPRRYNCQPDLVERALRSRHPNIDPTELERALDCERLRVAPQFNSVRYGRPDYCQLAHACADEIKRGADDQSEMGVFKSLYQPQRTGNLRARLEEYTPAGMEAGIIFAS